MQADVLVIGAGTSGLRTAITAAANGKKVVLVGEGPIAGTCLNNGCIPSKAMLHAADVFRTCKSAKEVGISATAKVNFPKVMRRVRDIVHEGRSHAEHAAKHTKNLTYIKGHAKFVGPKVVSVGRFRISGKKVIIATGARPFVPPVPGLKDVPYMTNVEVVELKSQPKSITVIGGGYIACEYATFFASLGTKVTLLERLPDILMLLDEDLRSVIRESLEKMGVRIITNAATTDVQYKSRQFVCTVTSGRKQKISSDQLIVAAGRKPNTDSLGLDVAGIKCNPRGYINVNRYLQTSNKEVYAIGDVNGKALFAHAAKREGWIALEHAILNKKEKFEHEKVPWAVFTHPPASGFGRSEQQLKKENISYSVLEAPFFSCGKARIIREAIGKVKILHHNGSVLGGFIVGPDADNLIHELALLQFLGKHGVTYLKRLIHVHPTLGEIMDSLRSR